MIDKLLKKAREIKGAVFDQQGREVLDDTPLEIPVGFHHPPSLEQIIARHMVSVNEAARRAGAETFEEAEDFDCDDEFDSSIPMDNDTPYELVRDEELGREMYRGEKALLDEERRAFDKVVRDKRAKAARKDKKVKKDPDPGPSDDSDEE